MKRTKVVSSNIKSIGYDAKKEILEIEFHNGAVWQYLGVSSKSAKDMMDASSKGRHFYRFVKECYKAEKILAKQAFRPEGHIVTEEPANQILGVPAHKVVDLSEESGIDMSQFEGKDE